ncbi:MAG: hypothetical protein JNL18_00785 [Planctomycetaceae bacterium]|nr:hypothetical protein [Planctomycetaceae bacterium]
MLGARTRPGSLRATTLCAVFANLILASAAAAQSSSVSAWSAADFRIWGFVPNWATQSQINAFAGNGSYDHVSDVLYFGGVQPRADGSLYYASNATGHLNALTSAAATRGFALHSSMFTVNGGTVDDVWNSIVSNPGTRATFVNNVKNFLVAKNMKGYNLDWERPETDAEWSNYTQLAKDLRAVLHPLGIEVSVDDYGYADADWDDTAVFDAGAAYDQLFIMGYHYGASSNATFANTKLALTGQGAAKAFKNEQLVLGIGTWGANGPATVSLEAIAAASPNLPYDALTFTGTVNDISGVSQTGTWTIESRKQVREKVQLALDRNMPGIMSWTLHYDAKNKLSLHRVAQHYAMFKRQAPDLNLDGKVNAADANALANSMGTVVGATGTGTAAQFEAFYMGGNWERGDRDGNGFVNQADANWLANRYNALGVALPDRLAYSGTFEKFDGSVGLTGRWAAGRSRSGLEETGNFTQHKPTSLFFVGSGAGASKYRDTSVTIRNQNAAEALSSVNTAPRTMHVTLAQPIDLAAEQDTYITFLVRQNTAELSPAQINSANRTLSLELLNASGVSQYDFSFHGQQNDFSIRSQADMAGEDAQSDGFAADATYLFVGKISGNGAGANTLHASLFADGAAVGNFTDPLYPWMITAQGGADFDPLITDLQLKSLFEGSFTVGNLWVGQETSFFSAPLAGDFNADGVVDVDDLSRWHAGVGAVGGVTHWQGDANGDQVVDGIDLLIWQRRLGMVGATTAASAMPEPSALALATISLAIVAAGSRSNRGRKEEVAEAGVEPARGLPPTGF